MTKTEKIQHYMNKLGISEQEAKDLIEFDNMTEKKQKEFLQEDDKPKKASPISKVKNLKRKKETDENKELIKADFITWLNSNDNVINPQEFKNNQFGFFDKSGNFYSFKLTKHKTIQDGYKI